MAITSTLFYFLSIRKGWSSGRPAWKVPSQALTESSCPVRHQDIMSSVPVTPRDCSPMLTPDGDIWSSMSELKDTPCTSPMQGEAGCLSSCITMACDGAESCSDELWVPVIVTIALTDGESGHLGHSFLSSFVHWTWSRQVLALSARDTPGQKKQTIALPLEQKDNGWAPAKGQRRGSHWAPYPLATKSLPAFVSKPSFLLLYCVEKTKQNNKTSSNRLRIKWDNLCQPLSPEPSQSTK